MHSRRGFTIIEILVVVVVITILSGIVTAAYITYQERAINSKFQALASAITEKAERYYNTNNEYLSAQVLFNGTPTGNPPTNYQPAVSKLDIKEELLNNESVKFVPCSGTCSLSNKSYLYYLTKPDGGSGAYSYSVNGCTFTFPAGDTGATAYLVTYYDVDKARWMFDKSNNGTVTSSNTTTCAFS